MLKTILALVALFVLFGVVGRMDYETERAQSTERATRVSCPPVQPESSDEMIARPVRRGKRIVAAVQLKCSVCASEV